jgi:hypothetical protein
MGRMNFIFLFFSLILCFEIYGKDTGDSLFRELTRVIDKASFFDAQSIKRIDSIRIKFSGEKE